jgi:succinoglycan biosynthesis protein ExoU
MCEETRMGRARDVAVIIATFRGARTIATAVATALAEPEAAEVIVVNDASPDDVEAAARAADDGSGRLKLVTLATNRGPAAARNAGLAATRSSWVTVLDDDDLYEPGRLKRLLDFDDDCWDFIADDLLLVSESDRKSVV